MNQIKIGNRLISETSKPFILAEAVKLQTYNAEIIASKYSPAYWDTKKEPTKS